MIQSAKERAGKPRKVNICIFGQHGVGKTTQCRTLPEDTTLFVDLEAGDLAIEGWKGDSLDVRQVAQSKGAHPWEMCRAIAALIGGSDESTPNGPYSKAMLEKYEKAITSRQSLDKYDTIFIDSITVASRHALAWATQQEDAKDKNGKVQPLKYYGILGQEMMRWLIHLQHAQKSIILCGGLDSVQDDLGRNQWKPQVEGGKCANELPGIFDEVLTLTIHKTDDDRTYRTFVTQKDNIWGYPAKDRSGTLDLQEEPNLHKLMQKIRAGKRQDALVTTK